MTIENKLSRTLRTKLEDFLATARAGGIPDPGSEFLGGLGLSLEARRVVWIMKRYEMDPAETGVSDQVEPSKTGTGQPSELDTKPTKEPVASMPQQSGPASRPISRKWEPSEFGSAASGETD